MIFLEYFKRHLSKTVTIVLKNEMKITGILNNVDHFLNLQVTAAKIEHDGMGLQKLDLCSIRGSSVKFVELEKNEDLERRVSEATLLRFSFDK
ncbi:uncharacterized protein VICG_00735 [Vittaforma corneae ATCC 50505]|uniref:Sm domain-containing protein n=1 Tax=Vittaforma corneae (strain ATCC 50505) TaxID=993615 RepID=L2GP92_VITCO|nr:uncharacterized protein VICG_00735 [Vittaforma corneae ATCC 50505]ELA42335.1 hypothetical protein VICG_00735 [Vittaforma corneae ATCC 50505]